MPHLVALLTPTRAPHARLPKHWKGELSLQRWSDTRFLVASLALCFFLSPFAFPLLTFSLQTLSLHTFSPFRLFLLRTSLSSQNVPLSLFPHFFYISERLSSQNVPHAFSCSFLYRRAVSTGAVRPKLTPPHWGTVTMTTRALSKKVGVGALERMLLRKNEGGLHSS